MVRRPTLASVAKSAGVSRQTVSNVINSPEIVRPATLSRVQAVIAEVGYKPNLVARQLRTRESRVIGLRLETVTDPINGSILDEFLHALTEALQEHGYRVTLFTAPDSQAEVEQYSQLLESLNLDGFILTSTHANDPRTQWLSENNVPFVTFGRPWVKNEELEPHSWVDIDGYRGVYDATSHLISLGHSKIAFVGWPSGSETGDDRKSGWVAAMQQLGQELDLAQLQFETVNGTEGGERAVAFFDGPGSPTAYVCVSDSIALGVLTELNSRNAVASVTGFDNTPIAQALGITSVKQPIRQAAQEAVALLMSGLVSKDSKNFQQRVLLAPTLVPRGSSQ